MGGFSGSGEGQEEGSEEEWLMVSTVSTWDVGASGVHRLIAMGAWHLPGPTGAARELGTAARADGTHCGGTNVGALLRVGGCAHSWCRGAVCAPFVPLSLLDREGNGCVDP